MVTDPSSPSALDPDLPLLTPARVRGAVVEFRRVTVRYGNDRHGSPAALDDLSLAVSPGEICVLVGPSGCGKTTTLRLVNRLLEPTSGQVLLDGRDVAALDPVLLRRRIGYVIQQIGLFPHQTIAENVGTVPRLLKWPSRRIRQRVDELLALIGLDPARVRERYPAQLSGGERQRVGVARALAAEPPLLLMDEPFAAVDPIVRERLQEEFLRLQRTLGTTVLFVTHDVDEALKLATHVAVMRQGGRLAQFSPPAELLAFPVDEYVARFLGTDRTLKRLSVMAAGDLARWGAPVGGAVDALPTVSATAPARDALTAILTAPARAVVVTDAAGRRLTVATLNTIAAALATPGARTAPPPTAALAGAAPLGQRADGSGGEP
jgi:osmoprotectant transport system ATP-binding protein